MRTFVKHSIVILLFFFYSKEINSQRGALDSINNLLQNAKPDSSKADLLASQGEYFYHNGFYHEAIKSYSASLLLSNNVRYKKGLSTAYNGLGITYEALGNYEEAVNVLYAALKLCEQNGEYKKTAATCINIALINMDQKNFKDAYKNCEKALEICLKVNDKSYLGYAYNTLGLIKYSEAKYYEALPDLFKALALRQEINDKKETASSYCNLGIVYYEMGNNFMSNGRKDSASIKYKLSLNYHSLCLKLMQEMENEQGIAASYLNLGSLNTKLKDYKKAKEYITLALNMYSKIGSKDGLKSCYLGLMETDTLSGNYKDALQHHLMYSAYKDSLLNQENIRKSTQIQMQYEFDKKTLNDSIVNAEQKKLEGIKHEQEIQQQRLYTYGGVIGFAFMLVIAGVSFRAFKNKQKANLVITEQKNLVEKQKAEVEDQKRIIEAQKLKVEEHQKDIIDSITYAKRLQEAILPPEKVIKEHLPNSFIYYAPKDIVAGDFYWFEHINGASYIAAADCTGHGVPGAMVSVVCSNALNRALLEFKLTDPGKILDKTRELVLETFSRSDKDVKDGMDISLARIEVIKESKKLHPGKIIIPKGQSFSEVAESMLKFRVDWSGANNQLWFIRNGEFFEVTAHKQAIGKTDLPTPFPTHSFELSKNDSLYLITDGFADQFGGPKGKKFKYKQLQELLFRNQKDSPDNQKEILSKAFNGWKGQLEQIDDVTIIGIKI